MMKNFVLSTVIMLASFTTKAALELPVIFADNMILQREMPLKIWGKSVAGERVSIKFNSQTISVIADKNRDWEVTLKSMKAGGPYTLKVNSDQGETVIFKNILIGDVWICAGQSNMNFMLAAEKNGPAVLKSLNNSNIREYRCAMPAGVENPENNNHSKWIAAVGEKAASFSAVAFYFAKKVQASEHVPIGLIVMACGNTRAESWIDTVALKANQSLQPLLDHWQKRKANNDIVINHEPGIFYEAVVKPVVPFAVKGLLWYQGESNTLPDNSGRNINERTAEYKDLLRVFINDWRNKFKQQQLPFYIIQLPNYKEPSQDLHWANIRQSQLEMSKEISNVGLVVTIDVGDSTNIHPNNKQAVGERAANQALVYEYHHKKIIACGPLVKNILIEGNTVLVFFEDSGNGLTGVNGNDLDGFEIAGNAAPEMFFKANTILQNDEIIVSNDAVLHPVAVRYAWADNPAVSLFNKAGIPASPFLIKK